LKHEKEEIIVYKASKKDMELTKKIIKEEMEKKNINMTNIDFEDVAIKVLDISYSIGGGYGENTIRQIIDSMIKRNIY
jgi:hypothetical protein